jgi:hypothetical protein
MIVAGRPGSIGRAMTQNPMTPLTANVMSDGVFGWEWICVGVALLLDLVTWGEGRRLLRG